MRTLKFIVDGQTIKKDPNCNFDGLVPGSEGYLQAEFSFSRDWDGAVKVAGFYTRMGKECPPQILTDGMRCTIPPEATKNRVFKVKMLGKTKNYTIETNRVEVTQEGGSL